MQEQWTTNKEQSTQNVIFVKYMQIFFNNMINFFVKSAYVML